MTDPHDLSRFVDAQDRDGTYERALAELRAGRKTSHWIWFVFPQIAGLGRSATAQHFAIASPAEARAYLEHPVLGARLRQSAEALLDVEGRTAEEILGPTDAMKLRSSMTLFAAVDPGEPCFRQILDRYFDGHDDHATTSRL